MLSEPRKNFWRVVYEKLKLSGLPVDDGEDGALAATGGTAALHLPLHRAYH
jgi:hypothetical protein